MPLQTNTHEFSLSAMKKNVKSESDKRVSREAAEALNGELDSFLRERVPQILEVTHGAGRKTVRASDVKESRAHGTSTRNGDLPNAPVERILRSEGAERVSQNAVDELRQEASGFLHDLGLEMNRMADHADRRTVKKSDLELAVEEMK